MKRIFFAIIIVVAVICTAAAYYILFFDITEKTYDKMICYYLARKLTANVTDFEARIVALRNFVHENVHPISGYYNRLDTVAIEKLLSGIGWCDQQARVFMKLAHNVGITTRLLFLHLESGSSPHTVAEALAPDKRWVLVDVAYKLDLINRQGKLASQSDIRSDLKILSDNERVKQRARFAKRWGDESYLAIYYNKPTYIVTARGAKLDLLKYVPLSWIRPVLYAVQDKYIKKICRGVADVYERKMFRARSYHLLDYHESAGGLYLDIIQNSPTPALVHKAEFYYALLLKDEERYSELAAYIASIVKKDGDNNHYLEYLHGLRVEALKKLHRTEEAKEELAEMGYSLDAS